MFKKIKKIKKIISSKNNKSFYNKKYNKNPKNKLTYEILTII